MSNKRRKFSAEFKVKLVLEVLKNEKPLNQIAQENNILPKNLNNWKKQFLENAEIAMEPSKAVKEYKEQIQELEKKVDKYAKTVGKLTVERNWAVGKLQSLDLSTKREMIKVQAVNNIKELPSYSRQHELLKISRSYKYYTPVVDLNKKAIKKRIEEIAEDEFMCIYGEEKVYRQLKEESYNISLNIFGATIVFFRVSDLSNRNNMDYDKYDWPAMTSDGTKLKDYVPPEPPLPVGGESACNDLETCLGEKCCGEGTTYDEASQQCIPKNGDLETFVNQNRKSSKNVMPFSEEHNCASV
jgi:transposase-like protein